MIETLFNFLYLGIITLILLALLQLTLKISRFNQRIEFEDENSIQQLRLILSLSNNFKVDEEKVTFNYLNQERSLVFSNNKLILREGTVIYICDIYDLKFKTIGNVLKVYYYKNDQNYIRTLAFLDNVPNS